MRGSMPVCPIASLPVGPAHLARPAENRSVMFKKPRLKAEDSRSATLLRSYNKALLLSRLMLTAFFVGYVATLVWTIPWFPGGLSTEDYDARTAPLLFLLFFASATAFGAVYLRDRRRRIEQTLLTWNSVHDGLSDLRRREYFYDRIVIECERARTRQSQFTVAVLKLGGEGKTPGAQQVSRALSALEPLVKEHDCLASISPHEIGVLAPQVTEREAAAFTGKIEALVTAAFGADPNGASVQAGYAIFGRDATDAGELVGTARSRSLSHPDPLPATA
jgi:GGDEF domain-containing protein